jgi:hypothetical protein
VSLRDQENGSKEDGSVERSKIAIGRTPAQKGKLGTPWWRITIYAGEDREAIDGALSEALRLDVELQQRLLGVTEPK